MNEQWIAENVNDLIEPLMFSTKWDAINGISKPYRDCECNVRVIEYNTFADIFVDKTFTAKVYLNG